MKLFNDLVIIRPDRPDLPEKSGQFSDELQRRCIRFHYPELVAENACGDKTGLRSDARLLVHGKESGVLLLGQVHGQAAKRRIVLWGRPPLPRLRGTLFLFITRIFK